MGAHIDHLDGRGDGGEDRLEHHFRASPDGEDETVVIRIRVGIEETGPGRGGDLGDHIEAAALGEVRNRLDQDQFER